jgi:hypothetical protein
MPATVKLTLNQLAEVLGNLSSDEAQTLLEIIDRQNLKARWEMAKQEFAEGKLISEEELFQDLD